MDIIAIFVLNNFELLHVASRFFLVKCMYNFSVKLLAFARFAFLRGAVFFILKVNFQND